MRDATWLAELAFASMAAVALDDEVRAASLHEVLLPYAGRIVVFGGAGAYLSSVSHRLGALETTLGRHDDAVSHLEAAVAVNERAGALPWLARARYDLARALSARGGSGDVDRAGQLVAEADRTAEQLGMERLLETISDHLPSRAR